MQRAELGELRKDQPHHRLDLLVGVQGCLPRRSAHVAGRQRDGQLPPPRLGLLAGQHPLLEQVQLGLAHRPLQPKQQPVVVVHRVVDAVGVGQQRTRQRAQLQQLVPVGARARQPRHLDAQHQPHVPHGDLGDQPLEAHPAGRAGPRLAQVLVDHQHPRGPPAQRDRPLHQGVLQPGRLPMAEHLLAGGLAHVHHRQPLKVPATDLAAQPLPRQQRGHGRAPSPAGVHTSVPARPTSGTCAATTWLASTASHPTTARRLASGSAAQHCLAAPCGARVFPRRPRPALLATRAGSQPLDHLDQPQ
jgi:hypothetical protein